MLETIEKSALNVQRKNGRVVGFDISRKFWGRGATGGLLLNEETGRMCCLGFYSLACGADADTIRGEAMLSDIRASLPKIHKQTTMWLDASVGRDGDLETILADVNDDKKGHYNTAKKKEARIKKIFADNGITVNFID